MAPAAPSRRLAEFLGRFEPRIAAVGRSAVAAMRRRLPGAHAFVYDNYNALVVGFGPSDKPSHAIFSIAVYPKWVNLFFLKGSRLRDPGRLLKGAGKQVRSIRLTSASDLDSPGIRALIAQAVARCEPAFVRGGKGAVVIKSVSAKQRPRRPPARGR
jgi:hypothetical protein